jgi:Tfp pilus assembly protein FimT
MKNKRPRRNAEAGYSVIEMMFILAIMGLLSAMAVIQISSIRPGMIADGAMRAVIGQMMAAREQAITQRRAVRVTFAQPNRIAAVREVGVGTAAVLTTLSSTIFEGGVKYSVVSGLPDSPDTFGNSSSTGINYSASVSNIKFTPEGTLTDQDGGGVNVSVFVSIAGQAISARAVTVLGSTGRIRGYKWDGKRWSQV